MPTEIRCPNCNRQLKVPENLLGKMVRCPGCQQTFTAAAESPAAPSPVQPRPAAPKPPARPSRPAEEEELEEGVQEEAPVRRRRPAAEEYEEEPEQEAYDEDEDRPRRRRVASGVAVSLVSGPAIALMVVGIIDVVLGVVNLLLNALGVSLMAGQAGARGAGAAGNDATLQFMIGIPSNIITMVFGALIIFGSVRMKGLQSYGLAMTACIMAMIPCFNCCILGIPFGIWGLVMLNRPEVKEAFS